MSEPGALSQNGSMLFAFQALREIRAPGKTSLPRGHFAGQIGLRLGPFAVLFD